MKCLNDADDNRVKYETYEEEVKERCQFERFDVDSLPKNRKKLMRYERKLFYTIKLKPITSFSIYIFLKLTDINGRFITAKEECFGPKYIWSVLGRVNDKYNGFYNDEEVWKAICRVERGKVSNRMRFAIYRRDGNRCVKCGRRTGNLEIDHIIPIAKGGKSTLDNLQTLCPRCNKEKGANIETRTYNSNRW